MLSSKLFALLLVLLIIVGGALYLRIDKVEAPVTIPQAEESTSENVDAPATTTEPAPETATTVKPQTVVKPATPAPSKTIPPKPSYTLITYDGDHFLPRTLKVLKGTKVRYLNLSTEDMWVASNIHPVHNGYPERSKTDCAGSLFDMCKSIGKGEHWDFTFSREGTWDYHNHKSPSHQGEVEVNLPDDKPSIPGY